MYIRPGSQTIFCTAKHHISHHLGTHYGNAHRRKPHKLMPAYLIRLPPTAQRDCMSVDSLSDCMSVVCDRLKDKGVGKDAEWGSLLEKAPLRHADDLDSASLSHAVDIFVERHHLLWKV